MGIGDGDLLALLEAVASAQESNEAGLNVVGRSPDDVVRMFEEALQRQLVDAKTKVGSAERDVVAFRFPFREAVDVVKHLGMNIRAGVHVGEVVVHDSPAGTNVHIAQRIMALAPEATVWVSGVTAELLAEDPRFKFSDQGEQALKGIDVKVVCAHADRSAISFGQ